MHQHGHFGASVSKYRGTSVETMGLARAGPKFPNRKMHKRKSRAQKKEQELAEIDTLNTRIEEGLQLKGTPSRFSELPISSKTLRGLEECHFLKMTDIQKCALPIALSGLDVMGAAKTGSGKTLAFLIPILEGLFREKWTGLDGLGALVLSPTRELALQTFEVLRKIGKYHGLSAGLVIGGKNLKIEQKAISGMNILIATPGRLLQHMDQTSIFDWSNLKILVLDEADRILDLGFARTIDAILEEIPKDRQTMLFSATQTTEVNALARLSLRDPVQMSVHSGDINVTPDQLTQTYIICSLSEKMDRLFSFIKANLKSKIIVFMSSCKQVRFVYEAFCRLQPGIPLMHLHGRQKQTKRMSIFYEFCGKTGACLFATDVVARGLDFPAVDWVLQLDCPEDVDTYIHRVGRTARFDRAGNALLFLLPSETAMIDLLKSKKVPIISMYGEGKGLPPAKRPIQGQLQVLCSQDSEIKYLAQKALISYVRSVFLNGNKSVFKVTELPVDDFAASLGLSSTPRLRFAERSVLKNQSRQQQLALEQVQLSDEEEGTSAKSITRVDKMFRRKNTNVLSDHYAKLRDANPQNPDNDEELLIVKRRDHDIDPEALIPLKSGSTKASRRDVLKTKKKYALKKVPSATRLIFDDDDKAHEAFPFEAENTFDRSQADKHIEEFVRAELTAMTEIDRHDAERVRLVRKVQRIEKKRKAKEQTRNAYLGKTPRIGGVDSD